ncbi:MAG: hypothetical protein F6K24_28510 [Okeania sp. SIO2D1]|nr:hypothetical protein [Okeania sp. SIO2D1]
MSTDITTQQTCQALENLNFAPGTYLESGYLVMLDAFGIGDNSLSVEDIEVFLYSLEQQLAQMPKPCRLIIDSLIPLAIAHSTTEFVNLIYRKNRLLRQPGVVLLDIFLKGILPEAALISLLNAYDIAIELYRPNWGDMNQQGNLGYPSLRLTKARGIKVDPRPYPYKLSPTEGIVLQADYYQTLS